MVKNPPAKAGDTDLIPRWGRYPGERNCNPLEFFFFFSTAILLPEKSHGQRNLAEPHIVGHN